MNETLFFREGTFSSVEEMKNPTGSHRDAPVTVSFPVPRKAASKLRTLAISKDRRLLDLGVLAVQINEGESIVLGIKLGRRRLKKTEVESSKIKGNASRGRVAKKHSSLRNVGTIHHMPTSLSQADKPPAAQMTSFFPASHSDEKNLSKRAVQSNGEGLVNELFSSIIPGTSDRSSNSCNFHLSDYKISYDNNDSLSVNGLPSSAKIKESRLKMSQNSGDLANERSLFSVESSLQKSRIGAARTQRQTPPTSPAVVTGSRIPADRRLSSPNSQRTYSASPFSETSSTSSDENIEEDVRQLIYSCYVDKSKYSAAHMLKQLAKAHSGKKEAKKSTAGNTVVTSSCTVKTVVATAKSSTHTYSSTPLEREQPRVSDSNKKAAIPGSYREHVKNIRCNSLTSLTTSTLTVNSTLNIPANTNAQSHASQSSRSNIKSESPCFAERKLMTQHTTQSNPSKPSTAASRTANKLTGSTQKTPTYHGGRKVLWSSANVFPVNRSTSAFSLENSLINKTVTSLSQVSETTSSSFSAKTDVATYSQTTASMPVQANFHRYTSNKAPGQELMKENKLLENDLKTVIMKTPALPHDLQQSTPVTVSNTNSAQAVKPPTPLSVPGVGNIVQTESQGTKFVQNLTLARSTLPAANVVIGGTNTQTTWSNQQVSPTYFVGGQTQYGIYPAVYNTDVNNNQLGQQAVTATYPLNYVYPISFLYPYLSTAQTNSMKNADTEKVKQQKGDTEVAKKDTSVLDATAEVARNDPAMTDHQAVSVNTTNAHSTTSNAAPVQTQFIDLASSMRYWQQLNLLYRSRLQALASCNLANVSAVPSDQANATTTVTSTLDASSVVSETAVKSNYEECSIAKPEFSHPNISSDSYSEIFKRAKPEIDSELGQSVSKDVTSDRPSVIVAASCKDVPIKREHQCNRPQFEDQELQEMNERYSPKCHHGRLRHMSEEDLAERGGHVSTPTLSFIHDSSIACVNIGNSNGNGYNYTSSNGNHVGTRRTCKFHLLTIA